MRVSKLVGERLRDNPSDITIKGHALMVRGGYIKQVANGIYSLLPPTKRIQMKIERIIREEMDKVDGQEVLFPVVMPKELWEESGRYYSILGEMVRFKDRGDKDMVLGMTHEEAAVQLARNTVSSYQQLPFMIYQIQTKFRDEKRPRGGLIRVREFTMKDAYSFHMTEKDLEEYYYKVYEAYNRIFKRIGMKNFISVKSDSGMMGGLIAHEYMLLTPVGEDTIAICPECGYKANMEVAEGILDAFDYGEDTALSEVFTGDAKEISEVCELLSVDERQTLKAVSYAVVGDEKRSVLVFLRGDLEVNEAKLKKIIKADVAPKDLSGGELVAGNIGPYGLTAVDTTVIFDKSVENAYNLVCGANKEGYHFRGLNIKRDLSVKEFYDVSKVLPNECCPQCKKGRIELKNGIEIGNIFQLGVKYTKAMKMTVKDANGNDVVPIMGCYGIGVGRAIASIAEESNDDKGIIWPMTVAPWQVFLCPLRNDDAEIAKRADEFCRELENSGIEVLYDDRVASPGVKFTDGELLGIPLRVVISPRSLKNDEVEISSRDGVLHEMVKIENAAQYLKDLIAEEIRKIEG